MIHGLGRSGTTWALKTFDHHPNVFAAHEPEQVLRTPALYENIRSDDPSKIRDLVDGLFETRGLRAMRRRPILRKPYRSAPAHMIRLWYMYALSGLGRLHPVLERLTRDAQVPDFARLGDVARVVKTVSLETGLEKISRSCPDMKIVYVIRHPCGQVSSFLNGIDNGSMEGIFLPPDSEMKQVFGTRFHDSIQKDRLTDIEIISYKWAVYCGLSFQVAQEFENLRVVRYEDLCEDPICQFKNIFEWCGLDWQPECKDFLESSLKEETDAGGYHNVVRNPLIAANKWRDRMSAEDMETVFGICRHSAAASLFPDLAGRQVSKSGTQKDMIEPN